MLENIGHIFVTQVQKSLFEKTRLKTDKLFGLLSELVSDVTEVFRKLFDCSLVGKYWVFLVLF